MEEVLPEAFHELLDTMTKLELHNKDMQDMEFTIEDRKLYMLQTRNGKRTAAAAVNDAFPTPPVSLRIARSSAAIRLDPSGPSSTADESSVAR